MKSTPAFPRATSTNSAAWSLSASRFSLPPSSCRRRPTGSGSGCSPLHSHLFPFVIGYVHWEELLGCRAG